jgi:hypothetical protein
VADKDFDLYEFQADHVGRKKYVHVEGHSRSVPVTYTYKGTDGRNYVLPEFGGTWDGLSGGEQSAYVMPDMQGYVSPLEPGVVVHSRPQHRDHMRRHGVIEVGTEKLGNFSRSVGEMARMDRAGHDIARALHGDR